MATDIKVSELNEINVNRDINEIIINDRTTTGDVGVTKRIQLQNFLTPQLVTGPNIRDGAVETSKINSNAVTNDKISAKTITNASIADRTICTNLITCQAVGPSELNNTGNFTVNQLNATNKVESFEVVATNTLVTCTGNLNVCNTSYTFPGEQVANRYLKTDGNGNLSWDQPVEGDGTSLVFSDIFPVGTIVPWAANSLPADGKWLECNGTTPLISQYPELAALLGNTWGASDGTRFVLPNLQGRVPIGAGTGIDSNANSCTFNFCVDGSSHIGGEFDNTLIYSQMPAHRHVGAFGENPSQGFFRWGSYDTTAGAGSRGGLDSDNSRYGFTTYAGGQSTPDGESTGSSSTTPHNNLQPYSIVKYIIKALPDDIEQFAVTIGNGLSAIDNTYNPTADFNLNSKGLSVKADSTNFQYSGSGELQLKTRRVLTDTQFVRVNGGTIDLCQNSEDVDTTGLEYCLCDFTDAGSILDATTRCDIRGVYICTRALGIHAGNNPENATGANAGFKMDSSGYDIFAGYGYENNDDDGITTSQTFLPINEGVASFCLCHCAEDKPDSGGEASKIRNQVTTNIIGVQINKYA